LRSSSNELSTNDFINTNNTEDSTKRGKRKKSKGSDASTPPPTDLVDSYEDLPTKKLALLKTKSLPTAIQFHPRIPALLLVGSIDGMIELWDVTSRNLLCETSLPSHPNPNSNPNPTDNSINRVVWSVHRPEYIGVASHSPRLTIFKHSTITPTAGSSLTPTTHTLTEHRSYCHHEFEVIDILFEKIETQLALISASADGKIRVTDVETLAILFAFDGHEGRVLTICSRYKDDVPYLLSTSSTGEMKIWLFKKGSSPASTCSPPGKWCTCIGLSENQRFFSCGVGADTLVEWDETEGKIKRTYKGFINEKENLVRFDTALNKYLVLGDNNLVKFWHFDRENVIKTIDFPDSVTGTCVNPTGDILAVLSTTNFIEIFSPPRSNKTD